MLCSRLHLVFAFMVRHSTCTASYCISLSCIKNWAYILKTNFVKKIKNMYWILNAQLQILSCKYIECWQISRLSCANIACSKWQLWQYSVFDMIAFHNRVKTFLKELFLLFPSVFSRFITIGQKHLCLEKGQVRIICFNFRGFFLFQIVT